MKERINKNFSWSSNLAYAVGLITTDGNLSKNGRVVTLRSADMQLLKTFKKCLNIDTRISETRKDGWAKKACYRIQIGDVLFYRWLLKVGLFPNKTYTIKDLKIPYKYFFDFLRGHLDGDGCITTYIDKWNTFKNPNYIYRRFFVRFYSASRLHVVWLQNKITHLCLIRGHVCEEKAKRLYQNTSMWVLKFGKKDSLKLLRRIYYNNKVPCLIRKKAIAQKFINLAG